MNTSGLIKFRHLTLAPICGKSEAQNCLESLCMPAALQIRVTGIQSVSQCDNAPVHKASFPAYLAFVT